MRAPKFYLALLILMLTGVSCGQRDDDKAPRKNPADFEKEEKEYYFVPQNDPLSSIGFLGKRRGGEVVYFAGSDKIEIDVGAIDLDGEELDYSLVKCTTGSSSLEVRSKVSRICSELMSISSEGLLTIDPLRSRGISFPDNSEHDAGRLRIVVRISNSDPADTIHTVLAIRLLDTNNFPTTIKDKQFRPKELEFIDEPFRTVIKQTAFHGSYRHFHDNKRFGVFGGGSSSAWYLGKDDHHYYMASAQHATTTGYDEIRHLPVYFPYLDLAGRIKDKVYINIEMDFSIYTVQFVNPENAHELVDAPIDVTYSPQLGTQLATVGFGSLHTPLIYPGVGDDKTCRVLSESLVDMALPSGKPVYGYSTGCQVWSVDSGGVIFNLTSGKVISVIALGTLPLRTEYQFMANSDLLEGAIERGRFYFGAFLVPLSDIRSELVADLSQIDGEYREFVKSKFELGDSSE